MSAVEMINELGAKVQSYEKALALHKADPANNPLPEKPYTEADLRKAIEILGAERLENALKATAPKEKKGKKPAAPPVKVDLSNLL